MTDERREYQRLNLTKPLDAWFGDFAVQLIEVSARGALMLHEDELPVGSRALLRFLWRGEAIEITAEITRTATQRSTLLLIDASDRLRVLIMESAAELLRAREANASGDRNRNLVGEETLTAASQGARLGRTFLVYELVDRKWKCRVALVPDQPEHGFTVMAGESEDQIALLQRTFESGDEEARNMTRMIAELSLTR
jgi:hypothetical protein